MLSFSWWLITQMVSNFSMGSFCFLLSSTVDIYIFASDTLLSIVQSRTTQTGLDSLPRWATRDSGLEHVLGWVLSEEAKKNFASWNRISRWTALLRLLAYGVALSFPDGVYLKLSIQDKGKSSPPFGDYKKLCSNRNGWDKVKNKK